MIRYCKGKDCGGSYKADYYALRLCSCCRKKGVVLAVEQDIVRYFLDRNFLFRRDHPKELVLNGKEGQRNADVFHPFEVMRVGIHNIMETGRERTMNSHLLALCASTAEPALINKNQTGSSEQKKISCMFA